jgi:glycine cleavage system aminomethyltransferase T
MTLPAAVGSASQALVTTDGSGTLGFTSTSTFGISTGKAIAMAIVFG